VSDSEILAIFVDRFALLGFHYICRSYPNFAEARSAIETTFGPPDPDDEDRRDSLVIVSSDRPFEEAVGEFDIPELRFGARPFLEAHAVWCITPDQAIVRNGQTEQRLFDSGGSFYESLSRANHICYLCHVKH
jgi:hypothetical protein